MAKAGKRRTHTPSNEELKETGLRVNPVQIHVSKPESNRPGRLTMDKWGPPVSTKTAPAPGSKDRLRKELAAAVANTVRLQNGQQAEPQKAEELGV